jgi:hypothetical protein
MMVSWPRHHSVRSTASAPTATPTEIDNCCPTVHGEGATETGDDGRIHVFHEQRHRHDERHDAGAEQGNGCGGLWHPSRFLFRPSR